MSENKSRYYFRENTIYCGDNLEVLKDFPGGEDGEVDLIYIDPPFFSGRNYDILFKDPEAVKLYGKIKGGNKGESIAFTDMFDNKLKNYLEYMRKRIKALYRVLKPTGSFYLHCDWHASHYLKIECDKIFGGWDEDDEKKAINENKKEEYNWACIEKGRKNNFQNEIIWCYRTGGATKKRFSRKHDIIFFYSKTKNYNFNSIKDRIYYDKAFFNPKIDENGKYYADVLPVDFWEIPAVINVSKERCGYPTQKPEKLLEKIIKASSNEGDIVLDAFCGCGTTLEVAKRLKRKFIGIDKSPTACIVMSNRIKYNISDVSKLREKIDESKDIDWHTFQVWAIKKIGGYAIPPKEEHSKKEKDKKKRSVDGLLHSDRNKFKQLVPIEVKKHKNRIPPNTIRVFADKIGDRKLKGGIFITLSKLNKSAMELVELKKKNGLEIIVLLFEDLFNDELLVDRGVFPNKKVELLKKEAIGTKPIF